MTHATFTPHFNAFRLYDSDGGEAASSPLEAQNTNHTLVVTANKSFQLRLRVDETGGADGKATDDWQIQYSKNSGAYTDLTTTDGGDGIRAVAAGLTNDNATTNRATNGISDPGSGSFVAGEQSSDGLIDDMLLTSSNFTEHAYGIEIVNANVANNDTFDFRLSLPTEIVNNVTPRVTISKATTTQQALAVTATGTATKTVKVKKGQSATAVGTASVTRKISKSLTVTATGTPTLDSRLVFPVALAAAAAGAAAISLGVKKALNVTATGTAALSRKISKGLSVTSVGTASLTKGVTKDTSAGASGTAAITLLVKKNLSVTATGAATLDATPSSPPPPPPPPPPPQACGFPLSLSLNLKV